MSIPHSSRIRSRTALRDHTAAAMPRLLGAVVVDLLLDAAGLLVRERPPGAHGAPGPIAGDGVQAAGGVSRPPAADRLARDPEQVGDIGFGESQFTAAQGTEPERLEDLIGQLASVG